MIKTANLATVWCQFHQTGLEAAFLPFLTVLVVTDGSVSGIHSWFLFSESWNWHYRIQMRRSFQCDSSQIAKLFQVRNVTSSIIACSYSHFYNYLAKGKNFFSFQGNHFISECSSWESNLLVVTTENGILSAKFPFNWTLQSGAT